MIIILQLLFLSFKAILAQDDQQESKSQSYQLSLSYSTEFQAFIQSYRDTPTHISSNYISYQRNLKQHDSYLNSHSRHSKLDFYDENYMIGDENIMQEKDSAAIQAYVSIPDQNKHIQMQIFMGSRLQPYKLTFDLNYPFIWVKYSNCQMCFETIANKTNSTIPNPPLPNPPLPNPPQKNSHLLHEAKKSSQNIGHVEFLKKQIKSVQFDLRNETQRELVNCTRVKDAAQKGNYFSCDPNNSTCHLLEQNQALSYETPNYNFEEQNNNYTIDNLKGSKKYVIGDRVNDAIGFQKDVGSVIFTDFHVIKQQINIQINDLQKQNDGFIGFPFSKNHSIIQKLKDQKIIKKNSFSLYLYYEPTNAIQPCVILGDSNKNYYQGNFNSTKMWDFQNKYAIHFQDIKLGNTTIIRQPFIQGNYSQPNGGNSSKPNQGNIHKMISHQTLNKTMNKTVVEKKEQDYTGILSTQEFFIKFPEQMIQNLMNVMKDNYKIQCRKDVNKTVECLKNINQRMPDLSIQVDHAQIEKEKQFIHMQGEWYIWECKQVQKSTDLSPFLGIDSPNQKNITSYQICRTFFQVSDNSTQFQYYFGFSFMEKFYIEFDLDKLTISFSLSVRKSELIAAVPHHYLLFLIGPLTLLSLFCYYFWFRAKQIVSSNNQSSQVNEFSHLQNKYQLSQSTFNYSFNINK